MPGELTQEDMDRANALVDEAMHYVFNEYDDDHDGLIARREFFAFLWKLKADTGYQLNEGQMISCWSAMDPDNKEKVSYAEFVAGLEKIYDNYFYAIENGAAVPESQIKIPTINGEDASSYNTIRFKNSAAVAFFDMILQDERNTQETVQKEREDRARTLAEAPAPFARRSAKATTETVVAASSTSTAASGGDEPPALTATPEASVSRNSSVTSGADMNRRPSGLARPGFPVSSHDQERERKKKDAEQQLQRIMSERHKEERRKREEDRQKKAEDARKANEQAANALLAEPAWKRNMKASTRSK